MIKVVNKNTILFEIEGDCEPLVLTVQQIRDMPIKKIQDLLMYYAEEKTEIDLIYNIRLYKKY